MTTPDERSGVPDPAREPVSFDKYPENAPAEAPFDPYRYGAPEQPVPPEYAPPGYRPPPASVPPNDPANYYGGYGGYAGGPPPYGYPPYGQYPPPSWNQYPPPRTGNGKAIASLVLGILSLLLFWFSILDAIPVVLALVFGGIARGEAKRTGSGHGMATAGIALAVAGAVLATVFSVVVYTRVKPCFDNYDTGSVEYRTCIQHRL